ncbi:MAG: hypothetical protein ACW9W4_05725 [Candidatus Nitrosopumilus sp. bin_7KS]
MPTLKKKTAIYKKSWSSLSPEEKDIRIRSLEVVNEARTTNKSLTKIARQNKLSVKTVLSHTNAFKKVSRRWVAKRFDKISRSMIINEKGKMISVEIRDSRHASTIGKYHNAKKEFLNTGNRKKLSEFSKKKIRDSNGKLHSLETRPKKIIEIEERVEQEPDRPQVYEFE